MTGSAGWIAWAAGLFEGEGTVTTCGKRHRLALKMVDEETVRRFHLVVAEGTVYGPYQNRTGEKDGHPRRDFYYWAADGEDARTVAEMLAPWLSESRLAKIRDRFHVTSS